MRIIFIVIFFLSAIKIDAHEDIDKLKKRIQIINLNALGWCSDEKAMQFVDLVLEAKPKVCVEIGVFGGASFMPVACSLKHLKQGIIIGIDPWDNRECIKYLDTVEDKEHIDWWSKVKLSDVYHHFLEKLFVYEVEDYCSILRETSQQAASHIEKIDILHINGHRSEEQSTLDVKLYLPKVVSGGYIWMADSLSFNKQNGIDLLLTQCDVVRVIDNGSCILFKKR